MMDIWDEEIEIKHEPLEPEVEEEVRRIKISLRSLVSI